jgi:hypothetical protein
MKHALVKCSTVAGFKAFNISCILKNQSSKSLFSIIQISTMKVFNIIFVFLFVLFAALQYNDPDPYIWIPVYLYAAVLCWFAFRNKFYPKAYIAGIAVYSVYAVYKIFDQNGLLDWIEVHNAENIAETMKAEKPWIEESREFFGLVILIVVLLINLAYARRKKIRN